MRSGSVWRFLKPAGYATDYYDPDSGLMQFDCDDANPVNFPGNRENRGDGVDNNCNGYIDEITYVPE